MFSIVRPTILVGLGPHGHEAVSTSDYAFEEVFPVRPGLEGVGPAAVLSQGSLHRFEYLRGYDGLMCSLIGRLFVFDQTCVEDVVEDSPYRCRCKEPGPGYQIAVAVGQFLCVLRPEASIIEPERQLTKGRSPVAYLLNSSATASDSLGNR